MRKSRFTPEQILQALRQAESGATPVVESVESSASRRPRSIGGKSSIRGSTSASSGSSKGWARRIGS